MGPLLRIAWNEEDETLPNIQFFPREKKLPKEERIGKQNEETAGSAPRPAGRWEDPAAEDRHQYFRRKKTSGLRMRGPEQLNEPCIKLQGVAERQSQIQH